MPNQAQDSPQSKPIVLIGMMGAGKSSVGRLLAERLDLPFIDSDQEIELAAGMTIPQIFEQFGEPAFRDGERKVIARLLSQGPIVLATGGGAFMDETTRALIKKEALSIWLKADVDVLLERVSRADNRPLLKQGNPKDVLQNLMAIRGPVYAEADMIIDSERQPLEAMVQRVLDSVRATFDNGTAAR